MTSEVANATGTSVGAFCGHCFRIVSFVFARGHYPQTVIIWTTFIVVKLKSPFSKTLSQYPGSEKFDYWVKHVTICR